MQGIGMIESGWGAARAGAGAMASARFQASQLDQNAGQEIAAGQINAQEKQRQVALIQSKALAIAAASGGSASDPTVMNLIGRNAQLGSYESALAMYQGEETARKNRLTASAARITGQVQQEAYSMQGTANAFKGIGNLLSSDGAKSLYEKYSAGGPTGFDSNTQWIDNSMGDAGGYTSIDGGT